MHPRWKVKVCVSILAVVMLAYCFFLVGQGQANTTRVHNQACASYTKLLHAVNSLAQDTLTPLPLPPHPSADQISSSRNAAVQKAARLKVFEMEIAAATPCPKL